MRRRLLVQRCCASPLRLLAGPTADLRARLTVMAVAALALVSACAGGQGGAAAPSPSSADEKVFDGTVEEYTVLQRACAEDHGLTTTDLPDSSREQSVGFSISLESTTAEEMESVLDECDAQLGTPKMASLTDAELEERYDARVAQFRCLVDNGLTTGEPESFEVFVDDYNRSGQKALWEPTDGAASTTDGTLGPTDLCPRTTW